MFLKEAQAATKSTDALCEYVVSRLVSLHGPCGTIHGNQHALQSYLKKGDDLLNYENLRTHGDLAPAANIHFEDKAKHLRKMLAGRFYNAKPVGEDCGEEATPFCLLMNTLKMYVCYRLANGDDIAFCFKLPYSSGEATWIRCIAGHEERDVGLCERAWCAGGCLGFWFPPFV